MQNPFPKKKRFKPQRYLHTPEPYQANDYKWTDAFLIKRLQTARARTRQGICPYSKEQEKEVIDLCHIILDSRKQWRDRNQADKGMKREIASLREENQYLKNRLEFFEKYNKIEEEDGILHE